MTLNITNHACVRYIERTMKVNLNEFRSYNLKDNQILRYLNVDKNILSTKIIINHNKTIKVLKTIGGSNISCKIGMGRSHKAVFYGNTIVTVVEK